MNRLLVIHKGEGKKAGKMERTPPSYRTVGQVGALLRYAISPNRQSQGKERVAGLVDGMSLGLTDGEELSPTMATLIAHQLVDDVPQGRRKIRHVILALASDLPVSEQVKILKASCHRYVARNAPGCAYIAILHDDHNGEEGRGLHAHLIIRNANAEGRAIDWSRDDLKGQQGMTWAEGLGVVPTRGTGVPRLKNENLPYPKAVNLNAKKLGELTYEQIETLISNGQLVAGRRNKSGNLTSVVLDGRRIRLSTARTLAARDRGVVTFGNQRSRSHSPPQVNGVIHSMAALTESTSTNDTARRENRDRSLGLGLGVGGEYLAGDCRRKRQRNRCTIRGSSRGVARTLANVLGEIAKPLQQL